MKIEIPAEVYAEYKVYAAIRQRSVSAVIEWALKDWFETVGEGHLEEAVILAPKPISQLVGTTAKPFYDRRNPAPSDLADVAASCLTVAVSYGP